MEQIQNQNKAVESNKSLFISLCKQEIKREGLNNLLAWLEKSDFYTAPASARYHSSYEGGLVQHSLNVYTELKNLHDVLYTYIKCTDENIAVAALFHDLCKVNFYGVEMRNRKNEEGRWEKYPAYKIQEKFCFGGHGSKSVFLIQQFMKLEPIEAVAINCHMGLSDNEYVGNAYEQYPFAWLLHVADEAATWLVEGNK